MIHRFYIEPELLTSLYWGNGYSMMRIANIFDCSEVTIWNNMKKYGIPRCHVQGLADNFVFTDRQKQIFEGCMLGDGGLEWTGSNCDFINGDIHKEYLIWLQKQLGVEDISSVKPVYEDGYAYSHMIRTRVIPSIRDEHKRWYPYETRCGTRQNRQPKIIPKDVELTLTKVLFWYIGDGNYEKRDNAMTFGNKLNLDGVGMLRDKLGVLLNVGNGISVVKHGKDCSNSQIYNLRLNRVVANKFFKLVDDLDFDIPECYQYKFGR